jgi:hypothetical protein
VLVVGLGPAGYTLSHYLLNEGFGVVAIDGLKIEPLPDDLTGAHGHAPRPIRQWSEIYRPLDERVLEGFGGVSEYGITVRWDKNFLTLIHLTLARRAGCDLRRRPLRRHADRSTRPGQQASITWRLPPARAGRPSSTSPTT